MEFTKRTLELLVKHSFAAHKEFGDDFKVKLTLDNIRKTFCDEISLKFYCLEYDGVLIMHSSKSLKREIVLDLYEFEANSPQDLAEYVFKSIQKSIDLEQELYNLNK